MSCFEKYLDLQQGTIDIFRNNLLKRLLGPAQACKIDGGDKGMWDGDNCDILLIGEQSVPRFLDEKK